MTNITILKDETLGGVLREYREVKRKAAVGERIKIVASSRPNYPIGEIGVCTRNTQFADWSIDTTLRFEGSMYDGFINADVAEYAVLEPTDILRIDDTDGGNRRHSMVDRKAAVGERVIVTRSITFNKKPGDLGVCTLTGEFPDASIDANLDGYGSVFIDCEDESYAVLEPVTSASPVLLSEQPAEIQAAAHIATLTLKLTELETKLNAIYEWHRRAAIDLRVAREDIVLIEEGISDDIKALEKRILALETDSSPAYVDVHAIHVKTPQEVRDAIVERAKADVERISTDVYGDVGYEAYEKYNTPGHVEITFKVDREKRTVVALLGLRYCSGHIYTRGIAKAAPGDVFNAHIGRAIALHRALGLDVPAEYLSVPGPEEVRVGDVIKDTYNGKSGTVMSLVDGCFGSPGLTYDFPNPMREDGFRWTDLRDATITDDSREDSGVVAASSPSAPRKEAA